MGRSSVYYFVQDHALIYGIITCIRPALSYGFVRGMERDGAKAKRCANQEIKIIIPSIIFAIRSEAGLPSQHTSVGHGCKKEMKCKDFSYEP